MKYLAFIIALILFPSFASAATLYLSPSSSSYTAGKAFTVNVFVSSPDEPMNAVSGTISVPSDMFSIASASSVGSIVNFWVQQPQVSGTNITFEGVVLNPGYEGSGGKVGSFVLVPKKPGSGAVSFASASVLANDGQGTNILDSASGAQYSVREAPATPEPEPQVFQKEDIPPPPSEVAEPPRIVEYDASVRFEDLVAIRGVTYEHAAIEIRIYKDGVLYTTERADSTVNGDFSVVVAKRLPPGAYEIALIVTREDGTVSDESERSPLKIEGDVFSILGSIAGDGMGMVGVIALALVALLAVLHAYGWHRLFALSREVRASQGEATDVTRKVFALLKKDVASHVKKLRAAGEVRVLTKEELAFLEDFSEELEEAETAIAKGKKK